MLGKSLMYKNNGNLDIVNSFIIFYSQAIYIHGWLYHIETGHIEEIVRESHLPNHLK